MIKMDMTWLYRRATWRIRPLPDFIIIGAQKSGTTSLYSYLRQHPHLRPSFRKEVHFFDGGLEPGVDNFEKGQAWYRANFPSKLTMGNRHKIFEASPLYIFNPLAPARIFALVPKAKIIAVLRNPTERAISQYFQQKRKNRESLSILDALKQEERRLESAIRSEDYKSGVFIHQSYKSRGLYKEQLERYLRYFPPDQILILRSEELFTRTADTLRRVFEFVGVEPGHKVKDLTPRNVARDKGYVCPDVYDYLNSYFKPHNQTLYELVGENYGW
jgi:hypothetical protein